MNVGVWVAYAQDQRRECSLHFGGMHKVGVVILVWTSIVECQGQGSNQSTDGDPKMDVSSHYDFFFLSAVLLYRDND